MEIDQDTALRLVGEALGLAHLLGDIDEIHVRSVDLIDQSLTVEALAASEDPISVRNQCASIMGGLTGLDVADLFPMLSFTTFAVRLVDRQGEDVFWIMSSPDDARFAETGAVRWLANSIYQDNTPAYRRSQADRLIGQLETGLRNLLHLHCDADLGDGYASALLPSEVVDELRRSARREGEDDRDDRTLLDYMFLPQLAKLVCDDSRLIDHGCVQDPLRLKCDLADLNKIRRKVAHHRSVTDAELASVRRIVRGGLEPVGARHPELISDFLSERWDDAVNALVQRLRIATHTGDAPPAGTIPESERRAIAISSIEQQLDAARECLSALTTLVVPATRQSIHHLAEGALRRLVASLDDLDAVARLDDLTLDRAQVAHDDHVAALAEVSRLGEEIQRIRVLGQPSQ